ncbi:MAG: DUF192 domain-containing protein [Methyloligellaceae bacterium]
MNVLPRVLRSASLSMLILLLSVNQLLAAEPQVLDKSELVLESGERTFRFEVELAAEAEERRVGLMHRREMGADRGMLFDFGQVQPVSMWMRNTYIPLDMLFIDEGGEVVNIAHDTVPHSEAVLSSAGPVRFVLEVPAGTSRLLGIGPGDVVRHEAIGNMPDAMQVNE